MNPNPAVPPEKLEPKNWIVRCIGWTQRVGDGIAREWITRNLVGQKNLLLKPTCGASFLEQLFNEFRRLDCYPPASVVPAATSIASAATPAAMPAAGTGTPAVLVAEAIPNCPASGEYRRTVREFVDEIRKKYDGEQATWDDYFALRKMMLPLYPRQELVAMAMTLRDDFLATAAQGQRATYERIAIKPLDPSSDYPTLLSHAVYLQENIARMETYRPHQELKRNYITFELFASLVVTVFIEVIASLAICKWFGAENVHVPFIVLAMIFGALGAAVSYQRRLQESFDQDGSILNTTRYVGSGVGVKLTPMQGSIFAMILLFIAYSGLAGTISNTLSIAPGPATPAPVAPAVPEKSGTRPRSRVFITGPEDISQFAKLLLFAFLAGFAERLVPDTLDRLSMKKTDDKKQTSSSPPSPAG